MPLPIKKVQLTVKDGNQYVDGDLLFNIDAEAWARGTRAGQPVSSTDETYHNNAKYYVESSVDAINDAKTTGLNAINSAATTGLNSVNSAATSGVSSVNAAATNAIANFPVTAAACDILAGDFAATYDPTATYQIGDYCLYQYQLYKCKIPIVTPESSFISSHWDQITAIDTLNDQIDDLKNAVNYVLPLSEEYWVRKGLASATGKATDSTIRISTIDYISKNVRYVYPKTDYELAVFAWDDSDVYQGVWDGSAWVKTGITWFDTAIALNSLPGNYNHKILGRFASNDAITLSVCPNFVFGFLTDKTFTKDGVPADMSVFAGNMVEYTIGLTWTDGKIKEDNGGNASDTKTIRTSYYSIDSGKGFKLFVAILEKQCEIVHNN